ncbi:3-oxoacyl-reductase, partial [Corynespora cassiicola Philippines]
YKAGIGRATALAFATAGCSGLALADVNEEGLEATMKLIKDLPGVTCNVQLYTMDVLSLESVQATYKSVRATFGRLDYQVDSHGLRMEQVRVGDSPDVPLESFDYQNNILYRGVWLCHREALRIMRDQTLDCEAYPSAGIHPARAQRGAIVTVNAGQAIAALSGMSTYSAAKSAVLGLVRGAAVDNAKARIRLNAVLPGTVDTTAIKNTGEMSNYLEDQFVKKTPFQRKGMPEEIADLIVFLASNKASWTSGASYLIDGGVAASGDL